MSWKPEVEGIEERKRRAVEMGGEDAVAKQHEKGRLTIRERIARATDPGSFREQGPMAGYGETDAERPPRRIQARQLRPRHGEDRRPAGGDRRRGLHPARRLALAGGPAQERLLRDPGDQAPPAARALPRGRRRQRHGQRRQERPPPDGRRGLRPAALPLDHGSDEHRARRLRRGGCGRGLPSRAPRGLALLGDDEAHGPGADRRAGPGRPAPRARTSRRTNSAAPRCTPGAVSSTTWSRTKRPRSPRSHASSPTCRATCGSSRPSSPATTTPSVARKGCST